MIGAWPVTWKVSSNRKARVWRTKKTRSVPPPHLLRVYCPAGRVWLQRQRQALAWRTKARSARPCRTCCTFTVQRRVWRERNRQALAWRTKKTATPGRACCALTVPPDARAACHVEPPKRATRSRYAGPPMLFERDRACLELSFPAMPHACARRTPLYAPCGVRSPAWPRQDGVPPAGLHARAALNRETRENRENRENRCENRLKNKRKP